MVERFKDTGHLVVQSAGALDKDGRRRNVPPNALAALAVPNATFSFAMTVMECVSWVTEDFVWEHESVTEPNVLWKENEILEALSYDIDVPCPLQWGTSVVLRTVKPRS